LLPAHARLRPSALLVLLTLIAAAVSMPGSARADEVPAPVAAVSSVGATPSAVDVRSADVPVALTVTVTGGSADAAVSALLDGTTTPILLAGDAPLPALDAPRVWSGTAVVPARTEHGSLGVTVDVAGATSYVPDVVTVSDAAPTAVDSFTADPVVTDPTVVSLAWVPPAADGSTPASSLRISVDPLLAPVAGDTLSGTERTVPISDGALLLTGAAPTTPYRVTATPLSVPLGAGTPVSRDVTTGVPVASPAGPASVSASPGDAAMTVTWKAPLDDGGLPVLAYRITPYPSGPVVWAGPNDSSALVAPRTNGVATWAEVAAVNALGAGPGRRTATVVPRHPARLTVVSSAGMDVVYGTATVVTGQLRDLNGVAQSDRTVQLQGRYVGGSTWRTLSSGSTGSDGRLVLRATLDGSTVLRLHHPADAVAAPDLAAGSVTVAARVSASKSTLRLRQHHPMTVSGTVGPSRPAGSSVLLQKLTGDSWRTVVSGKTGDYSRYALRWSPPAVGSFRLRVVIAATTRLATGTSASWVLRVDPENVADVAADILRDHGITEATVHSSGVRDRATARWNVIDLAAGRAARRSSYENAPGGSTRVDIRLLEALRAMGLRMSVGVSEIAGGSHAPHSAHYDGQGLDINIVNGRHVGGGASYSAVVSTCRAFGATHVYSPSYDPYGGHNNHVHCEWS
jgi:hypothetical protein